MFSRKEAFPLIMVAPNGARKSKADHPNLPVAIGEIRNETVACAAAGADALHLHIRDSAGRHSLDPGLYREAIDEIHTVLPGFPIQVTTESAGIFDVDQQLDCLKVLRPRAASISVREIARRSDLAPNIYGLCNDEGVSVQHILYDKNDWQCLNAWHEAGIVRDKQRDVIFVLGQYAPAKDACLRDVDDLAPMISANIENHMVCAFGPMEQAVLCAAAAQGAQLRVGFENNLYTQNGEVAPSNAANVASLKNSLLAAFKQTPAEGAPQ